MSSLISAQQLVIVDPPSACPLREPDPLSLLR